MEPEKIESAEAPALEYRLTEVEVRQPFERDGEKYGFGLAVLFTSDKDKSTRQLGLYLDPGMPAHEVADILGKFANVLKVRLPSPIPTEPTP